MKSRISLPIVDVEKITAPFRDMVFSSSEPVFLTLVPAIQRSIVPHNNYWPTSSQMIEVTPINQASRIFTDIFPTGEIYKGPISALWHDLEEFYDFLLDNNFLFGFLIFLFNELLTNIAYQSSLLIMSVFYLVHESPVMAAEAVEKYRKMVNIFTNNQLRGIWWLNITTDIQISLQKALDLVKVVWNVISKFYLVSMLVLCIGFLQNAAPKTVKTLNATDATVAVGRKSILEDIFAFNILDSSQNSLYLSNGIGGGYGTLMTPLDSVDQSQIPTNQIIKHIVQDGENIEQIAAMYNISIESIAYNNQLTKDLVAGQELQIPPVDAYIYTIVAGDNLDKVAGIYKVEPITISSLNNDTLEKNTFKEGVKILIPGISFEDIEHINKSLAADLVAESVSSRRDSQLKINQDKLAKLQQSESDEIAKKRLIATAKQRAVATDTNDSQKSCGLIWPTSTRQITQYASRTHMALDIANRSMPDLYAAKSGKVVFAGWDNSGYGNMILIDHGNGYRTRYGHNNSNYVKVGDTVTQGEAIAKMGNTGNVRGATGIHLHYEVIVNGKLVNPMSCY